MAIKKESTVTMTIKKESTVWNLSTNPISGHPLNDRLLRAS